MKIGTKAAETSLNIKTDRDKLVYKALKAIEKRREVTFNLPDMFFGCQCHHDLEFHIKGGCLLCKCKYFIGRRVKLGGFIPNFKPKQVTWSIRDNKSKSFWKSVELDLIDRKESPIMK